MVNAFVSNFYKLGLKDTRCGTIGRAVFSKTKGPKFTYSHFLLSVYQPRYDKRKEKDAGIGPFKKPNTFH